MLAVLAALAFLLGLVFHLAGHGTGSLVTDMLFAGLALVALHLAFAVPLPAWPPRRP